MDKSLPVFASQTRLTHLAVLFPTPSAGPHMVLAIVSQRQQPYPTYLTFDKAHLVERFYESTGQLSGNI